MAKDEILTKEIVQSLADKATVDGYVLMDSYTTQVDKNTNTYLVGTMSGVGKINFKIWGGALCDRLIADNHAGRICRVKGAVNDYNGNRSIVLDACDAYDGTEFEVDDFLEHKYDAVDLFVKLRKLITDNCTESGVQIFDLLINPIKDRFCKEFAASFHHDSCPNGLLAHTYKTVRIVQIIKFYPELSKVVDKDTLFLTAALHDIGKVREYCNGNISEDGMKMSHLSLGLEMIAPYRDKIIALKGEMFYNYLFSVIQQHHGEYGERPRTLVAYLIHLIDGIEAKLTDADDAVASATMTQIKLDDYKLSFTR